MMDTDYILYYKDNINEHIENDDYKSAFRTLVMVLNIVDDEQKKDIIKYYDDLMFDKYVS